MADDLLKEIKDQTSYASTEWQDIRTEGNTDMRFVAGDPWEPEARSQREKAKRPIISPDELGQYTNQAINDVRANKRAVKFSPRGNGATDKSALLYADKMREIEYRSRAQIHYTTAFQNSIERSYGFVRVNTKYEHIRSRNQDIYIDGFPNPNLVLPDPDALLPDSSDMKFCVIRQPYTKTAFKARWPKAKVTDFNVEHMRMAPDWIKADQVLVGEYWKVQTRKRTLLSVSAPGGPLDPSQPQAMPEIRGFFKDELPDGTLPEGYTLHTENEVDDQSVVQYLTNGIEILSTLQWAGRYIPIVSCLGKVLYVEESGATKRKILSMVRLARDPYMLYCYCRTCEAELVGMTPKFPYFYYDGQLDAKALKLIQQSLHEPVAAIPVKPLTPGLAANTVLPLPQRQPYEPPLVALEALAEAARRSIQAAMGWTPLPSQAQRRNDKSGVALKHIEESGQRGSFHFTDHYLDMLTQVGIIVEDLMDKIYDTDREVGIRKDDDKASVIRINTADEQQGPSTKGDHGVTVSTGPSDQSTRNAAEDFADTLIASPAVVQIIGPQKAAKILALAVKLKNVGPLGDQIAEVISPTQQTDGTPSPEQLQQQLSEAKAMLEQAGKVASAMKQQIDTDAAKQQATIEKGKNDNAADLQKAQIAADNDVKMLAMKNAAELEQLEKKNATSIRVAEISAATKGYVTEADHAAAHEAQALDQDFTAGQASIERENVQHEAERTRQHEDAQAQKAVQGQIAVNASKPQPKPTSGASA